MAQQAWKKLRTKYFDDTQSGFRLAVNLTYGLHNDTPAIWGNIAVMPDAEEDISQFFFRIGNKTFYDNHHAEIAEKAIRKHGFDLGIAINSLYTEVNAAHSPQEVINGLSSFLKQQDTSLSPETLQKMTDFLNEKLSEETLQKVGEAASRTKSRSNDTGQSR